MFGVKFEPITFQLDTEDAQHITTEIQRLRQQQQNNQNNANQQNNQFQLTPSQQSFF